MGYHVIGSQTDVFLPTLQFCDSVHRSGSLSGGEKGKGLSLHTNLVAHQAGAYPGFLSMKQGAKKEGRRNGQSTLGRCVMRSRTGSSALHYSKVQNMAASECRWLVEKSDCHAKPVRGFHKILLEMK